jgi:EXLDI family protein
VPNRTIYVSEGDQELFKRAQELAGDNLSAAISSAVKRYVEFEMGRAEGFDEITVKVGIGAGRKVRFAAIELGQWVRTEGDRWDVFRVYRGRHKFALHIERNQYYEMRDAQGNPLTGWRAWTGIGMAAGGGRPAEGILETADPLEELRDKLPPELYEMVASLANQPVVEDLEL